MGWFEFELEPPLSVHMCMCSCPAFLVPRGVKRTRKKHKNTTASSYSAVSGSVLHLVQLPLNIKISLVDHRALGGRTLWAIMARNKD